MEIAGLRNSKMKMDKIVKIAENKCENGNSKKGRF